MATDDDQNDTTSPRARQSAKISANATRLAKGKDARDSQRKVKISRKAQAA